ncbi:MAG: hypothetical protein COA38_17735 [Fluviicola sp.]|nr:MAG: hypothetical protein COA38_17735 [Fluviicola sp.]
MKKLNSQCLTALFALFLSCNLVAQENQANIGTPDRSEDSLIVIKPEEKIADLRLIIPPEGFESTERFNGYLHTMAGSGIIMTMIDNVNYIKLDEAMTEEFFASEKLTFIKKESFTSDNGISGIHYKSTFNSEGKLFIRYLVFAGDLNKTLWLNITYPFEMNGLLEAEILKSIQSITLNPTRDEN